MFPRVKLSLKAILRGGPFPYYRHFTSHKFIFSPGLSMKKINLFTNKKEKKRWIKRLKVDIISWLLVSVIFCLLLLVVEILSC